MEPGSSYQYGGPAMSQAPLVHLHHHQTHHSDPQHANNNINPHPAAHPHAYSTPDPSQSPAAMHPNSNNTSHGHDGMVIQRSTRLHQQLFDQAIDPMRGYPNLYRNGDTTIISMTKGKYRYSLDIRQQPIRARMCGFGDKDRRPITPPPCIRVLVTDIETDMLVPAR
jgi:hypothetical protein